MDPPGTPTDHVAAEVQIPAQIVEAVSGQSYGDYVQDNIFRRCGMTGTGFFTRPQWLTDPHIAQPYMTLADGSQVDAVRHLDQGSPAPDVLGKNPGRAFIDASTAVAQVVGNLLVFAALGFFAPIRFSALASAPRILALGAGCSVFVETLQYVLQLGRVSSVDDVLLNAAGAFLAALASRHWWRVSSGVKADGE